MQRIDDLIARVRRFVAEETPSLRDGGAVLAVSGGGDSMAMASLLIGAGIVRPAASVVAHFDHRSRGQAAAAADRAVVAALCARYGIEMVAGAWETPRRGEAAARDARYRFLVGVARDRGIGVIATAHTADDQVETLVMCEMRGAGVYGMRGIAAERMVVVGGGDVGCWGLDVGGERRGGDDGGWTMGDGGRSAGKPREAPIRVVRPVLGVTGGELRAWCVERGLAYVDDASNADLRYLRNRVRHEVLPRMEVDEPGVRARMIAQAADARTRVAEFDAGALLCRLPADAAIKQAHAVLDRAVLRAMPDAAAVHAYRVALTEVLGDVREFGRGHYETMVRAASGATGSTYEMPRGVV